MIRSCKNTRDIFEGQAFSGRKKSDWAYVLKNHRYVNLPNFSGDSFQLSWQILGSGLITL